MFKNLFYKKKINDNKNVLKLMFESFFHTPETYIFSFIIPLFISIILFILKTNFFKTEIRLPIVGVVILASALGMMFMSLIILNDWKDSILIKRIKIKGISNNVFITSFVICTIFFGIVSLVVVNLGIFLLGLITNNKSYNEWFVFLSENVENIFGFIFSYLIFLNISILISILITGWIKKRIYAETIILIIIILIILGSDIFFDPVDMKNNTFYFSVGFIIVTKYPVWLSFMFSSGVNIDSNNIEMITPKDGNIMFNQLWKPLIFSLIILISLIVVTYSTFRISRK